MFLIHVEFFHQQLNSLLLDSALNIILSQKNMVHQLDLNLLPPLSLRSPDFRNFKALDRECLMFLNGKWVVIITVVQWGWMNVLHGEEDEEADQEDLWDVVWMDREIILMSDEQGGMKDVVVVVVIVIGWGWGRQGLWRVIGI
jgi:hypothetical protein